jgi:CubicO group peptidase (beta-lactamase class C family)
VPGLCFAVATPDDVVHADAVGFADLGDRRRATVADQHPWFSMTKIATATAAVRLHSEGLLDLDAPITSYLPGYVPDRRHGCPTTRQLLSHTAGLGNPLPVRWVRPEGSPVDPGFVDKVVAKHGSPRRPVGARAAYSNIGYLLAGQVLEAVTGRPVDECVRSTVLEPLELRSTGYAFREEKPRSVGHLRVPGVAVPFLRGLLPKGVVGRRARGYTTFRPFLVSGAAYGGLVGDVTDAVRLAAVHAAAPDDPHPVLGPAEVDSMRTITHPGKPFDHGIGWFRRPSDVGRGFVEHYGTGGGFWNAMRIYPEHRLAMVAMANTTSAWDVDRLFTGLLEVWS